MVPIRLYDSLSLMSTPPAKDGSSGRIILGVCPAHFRSRVLYAHDLPPPDEKNLVVRALELLQNRSGCRLGARVDLIKRIPISAGLGGGSSDAAAAIQAANLVWGLGWSRQQLAELGAELGSDVPFFLYRRAAICRGRGEQIEPLAGIVPLNLVVVKPSAGLATVDVYRTFDTLPPSDATAGAGRTMSIARALGRGALGTLRSQMSNHLQAAAATLSQWVEEAHAVFSRLDFVAHQLSGSGTAYFGVCRNAQHAHRMATTLRTKHLGEVYTTRSC